LREGRKYNCDLSVAQSKNLSLLALVKDNMRPHEQKNMTVVTISCFQCLIPVQQLLDLVLVFVKKLYVAGTHIYCSIFTAAEQQPPPPQRVILLCCML